jgi:hypothetical protein
MRGCLARTPSRSEINRVLGCCIEIITLNEKGPQLHPLVYFECQPTHTQMATTTTTLDECSNDTLWRGLCTAKLQVLQETSVS